MKVGMTREEVMPHSEIAATMLLSLGTLKQFEVGHLIQTLCGCD